MRGREILEAFERWDAECKDTQRRLGLYTLDEDRDRLYAELEPIDGAIIATPARTLEGVMLKASRVRWFYSDEELDPMSPEATADRLSCSMVVDLLGLGGAMRLIRAPILLARLWLARKTVRWAERRPAG